MENLSVNDKLSLIKARGQLAKEIRDRYGAADLSQLVRDYNRAVSEMKVPTSTTPPQVSDPLELKSEEDLSDFDMGGLGAPEISEEVDRAVSSENLLAAANLYAAYHYDKLGVFDVVQKVYEDFFDGNLRITTETGALALYRYEKRKKDRYSRQHRQQMYKRLFNYGPAKPRDGMPVHRNFQRLFLNFIRSVVRFYRDQRISEVIRRGAAGLESSFGSLEMVRKAGVDLRHSVNYYSSGIALLFTMELAAYLRECLDVLRLPEIHQAYNVRNEWSLIEKIAEKRLKRSEKATTRSSLAQEGKYMLEWLAGDDVLEEDLMVFEITLNRVGQSAERWLVSYRALAGRS